jgi:predicted DCC family thiol-disulfide oxidoreductase YuxK
MKTLLDSIRDPQSAIRNQWTGGQYSLFRVIFGSYLFIHFVQLIPWGAEMFSNRGVLPAGSASPLLRIFPNILALYDAPAFVTAIIGVAAALSALLIIGLYDRIAAIALWYVLACLFGRNPLIANPSLPYVGLLLLAHACLPRAPYGSWERRHQPDPGSEWRMPQAIYLVVWMLMALGYSYSGYTKLISPSWVDGTAIERILGNPLARPGVLRDLTLSLPPLLLKLMTWGTLALELSFAPLALFRRARPVIWGLLLLMHLGLIAVIDFADLSLGMVMLHLFTFDPGWISPMKANVTETVFYDGHCGLCHRAVRFILAEDRARAFRFAPLDSDAFRAAVPEAGRKGLPDSVIVQTTEGELLVRSTAVLYLMKRLGGVWRALAAVGSLIPASLRDRVYDRVAGIRHRLFKAPDAACPIIPKHLRERFDY